jgi:ABC-2 type transport system permease protein
LKAFKALFKTEMMLSIRDMNTLFFGVGFSVVLTIVLGLVMGSKPAFEGASYSFMDQSFGAIASIGIAATGLMGMPLVVADYRHRKILKRLQVTPVSPALLLFVQFAVNFVVSILSLVIVYGVSALFFGFRIRGSVLPFLLSYLLVLVSIYSIGMMLASVAPNIKTANLLCSLFYFPMLLLSGATLPYEVMPKMMQHATAIFPLTQGIKLLKATALGLPQENMLVPLVAMITFAVVCIVLSIRFFKWE